MTQQSKRQRRAMSSSNCFAMKALTAISIVVSKFTFCTKNDSLSRTHNTISRVCQCWSWSRSCRKGETSFDCQVREGGERERGCNQVREDQHTCTHGACTTCCALHSLRLFPSNHAQNWTAQRAMGLTLTWFQ